MIRFLKALILIPLAIVVVLFAVANRASVPVSLDPFSRGTPEIAFQAPLFAVILGSVAVGILIGGAAAWFSQAKHRRAHRRYSREVRHLRTQTDRLHDQAVASGLPALTSASAAHR